MIKLAQLTTCVVLVGFLLAGCSSNPIKQQGRWSDPWKLTSGGIVGEVLPMKQPLDLCIKESVQDGLDHSVILTYCLQRSA